MKSVLFAVAGLATSLIPVPQAQAAEKLEAGKCYAAASVRAELQSSGQKTIILGNRSGFGYPVSYAFTSNTNGTMGFMVRGDRPLGEQADRICVDGVYEDIHLNDVTKPGIPIWAQIPVDAKRVAEICAPKKLGYQGDCGTAASSLSSQEQGGQRVLFMASGSATNPQDQSVRTGQKIIVTYRASVQGGLVEAVTSEGADYLLGAYSSVTVTPDFEAVRVKR